MRISFLTPAAGLVAFAVIIPLVAFVKSERRSARVRSLLRLSPPGGSPRLVVASIVAIALLAGIGAAQPVFERIDENPERVDAQVFFVFDTSRSMLASVGRDGPSRFERAFAAAKRMRDVLGDVPVGVASMTDRVLPHVFPTANRSSFDAVLRHSIGVDNPPSDAANDTRATDLTSTRHFATGNFFKDSRYKVLVLFTDAESKRIDSGLLTANFYNTGIRTILIRFWRDGERVYDPRGTAEPYLPLPESKETAESYAEAVKGEAFDEGEVDAAIASVESKVGKGTSVARVKTVDVEPIGPYVFLAALLPVGLLLWRRNVT